ncbi:MAG: ATP-binding protein, partial [Planctomycetaceae bacterium]
MPSVVTANEFIPFERLSTGEKYALSFALAVTRLPGTDNPIIIMEEPETALYPAAIGKIMAALHGAHSPQLISTSHSESVLRRFGLEHIFRVGSHRSATRIDGIATTPALLRELERLIMPGSTSVLLVDKVLVVEGGGEVFASGVLDRLAAAICRTQRQQKSFASEGWTVLSANRADNIPETVEALKGLGMTVAALLDADTKGRDNAQKIKDKCPVFTYKKYNGSDVTLELALLYGLNVESRQRAINAFQKYPGCNACPQKTDVQNCISKNGYPLS